MFLSQLLMMAARGRHRIERGFFEVTPSVPRVPRSTYVAGVVEVGVPNKIRKRLGKGV